MTTKTARRLLLTLYQEDVNKTGIAMGVVGFHPRGPGVDVRYAKLRGTIKKHKRLGTLYDLLRFSGFRVGLEDFR